MIISDPTNKNGLIQNCEVYTQLGYGGISGNPELFAQFIGLFNERMKRARHLIAEVSGSWRQDDPNFGDELPFTTVDLVAGKSKYYIPSDALYMHGVEIKKDGVWTRLQSLAYEDITGSIQALREQTGTPTAYFVIDNVVELVPTPDFTTAGGIKFNHERGSYEFTINDSIKTPGIASPYQNYLAIGASIDYIIIHGTELSSLKWLKEQEIKLEAEITEYYRKRHRDNLPVRFKIKSIRAR